MHGSTEGRRSRVYDLSPLGLDGNQELCGLQSMKVRHSIAGTGFRQHVSPNVTEGGQEICEVLWPVIRELPAQPAVLLQSLEFPHSSERLIASMRLLEELSLSICELWRTTKPGAQIINIQFGNQLFGYSVIR